MSLAPCRQPGCPELVPSGYCAEHGREVEAVYRQRGSRDLYRSKRWRVLARRVLREQSLCATFCGELATEVDHIVPVEDGGAMWDRNNLQGLCKSCHSSKTRHDVASRTFQ